MAELVALSGWQWQTMHAARLVGASSAQIGGAIGTSGADAQRRFVDALDCQEVVRPGAADHRPAI